MSPSSAEPRIRQLPPSVITKIAAGEVIERPASVVKELLENSIDALATRIDVEVEAGGIDVIRVIDNGHGIRPDDLRLAFASHATSKLADADDLFRIGTLGFRGEALASIGGVAQVTLQSRQPNEPCGAEITCHGGTISPERAWNGSPGTRIEVRHLFFNTPVRRKFMRTPATEMGHVSEVFTRLALSHRHIHWTLRHGGKLVYEVPANADLAERVGLFFGSEVRGRLYRLEAQQETTALFGYLADPACDRGNARMQYLFVNGRWVRDRAIGHALQEGYRGLLMTGRYAVAFLFLDLPPDQVDVNVHPTKSEVRFRNGHAVYHLVLASIRERLRAENLVPRLQVPTPPPMPAPAPMPAEPWSPPVREPASQEPMIVAPPERLPWKPGETSAPPATSPVFPTTSLTLKAIQVHDAYLVVETPEGMLVIDQHALHERILFEQLKDRLRTGSLPAQRLLIPEPVELSAEQASNVLAHQKELAGLGLEVADFGGSTVLLSSYPAILGRRSPVELFRAVVDHLNSHDRLPAREVLFNDLLSLMACHSAVRSGDRLTPEEIEALVEQRALAHDTHHCPHGRPTALLFSKHDLERQFRRIV